MNSAKRGPVYGFKLQSLESVKYFKKDHAIKNNLLMKRKNNKAIRNKNI